MRNQFYVYDPTDEDFYSPQNRKPVELKREHFYFEIEPWNASRSTENRALSNLFYGDEEYSDDDLSEVTVEYIKRQKNRKTCMRCNLDKSVYEFSERKWSHDGRAYYCKSCQREVRSTTLKRGSGEGRV